MRVFVSSTSDDLVEHRAAACRGLRRLGHEVVAMEDFTAVASYPLDRVLERVRECDVYVGVVAWRYGYIPDAARPVSSSPLGALLGMTSITEYEYLAAKEKDIPILVFVLDESAPWPPRYMDGFGGQGSSEAILAYRARLMNDHVVSFFTTVEGLESQVTAAIANTRISGQVAANLVDLGVPVQAYQSVPDSGFGGEVATSAFGGEVATSGFGGGLIDVVTWARTMSAVVIDIATEWWSTRLYLLAYLLQRLTEVQRVVINRDRQFVGLLSVESIVRTVPLYHAELAHFERSMPGQCGGDSDTMGEAEQIVARFRGVFTERPEYEVKLGVNDTRLHRWFGDAMITVPIRIADLKAASALDLIRLLDYPSPFVPVVSGTETAAPEGPEVKVIDTRALRSKLARSYVSELLDMLGDSPARRLR